MNENLDIVESFENFRRENFYTMSRIGIAIYLFLSYIDSFMVLDHSLGFLFLIRLIFITPTFILFYLLKKGLVKSLDFCILGVFISASCGVSTVAYLGGGLSSDYYFGLVIVSFLQFTFVPMSLKKAIFLDVVFLLIYFPVNYLCFEYEQLVLIKQLSNYLTFSIMKFFAVTRSRNLIINGFKNVGLEKELTHKERVQFLFGKLCHLLNNPLFISMNMVRRINQDKLDEADRDRLNRSLNAQDRMSKVLRRMLELHHDQDVDLEKYQEFFNDDDYKG